MAMKILPRNKIDKKYKWNAESVYPSVDAWEKAVQAILTDVEKVRQFQGRLAEGPAVLLEAMQVTEDLIKRIYTAYMYANFTYSVESTNPQAGGLVGKVQAAFGQVAGAIAFLQPETLGIGRARLEEWMGQNEKLAMYRHNFDDLFRQQAHVRSAEVEEILGMVSDPLQAAYNSTSMLTNADFKFRSVKDAKGKVIEVTQGNYDTELMHHSDRKVRKAAYEAYMDKYVEHRNTLAANLESSIKSNVFNMRARRHESTLSATLFSLNIPTAVFHTLVETFRKNLPIWHRYFAIRRKVLGLKKLAYYDMWAPISTKKVKVPYEEGVKLICASLAPLGKEYVETVRRGCLRDRWVDVYPNQGKSHGAFSSGVQGTHPFIMTSYTDEVSSMSVLAHELGHSMHSYLTWQNQPFMYANYSLFAAEVASNFHQALMRAHLLKTVKDRNFQVALIEEAVGGNFFRYFFQMPTLARFELETHLRAERGEPLTADSMTELMADLFAEGFGPSFDMDRQRVGMTWSTFGHLFQDYYVYAYATGISGAHALASRILRGEPNAVEDYLGFLKAGSSDYPLNVLKRAGVDLTTPQPVEETFTLMNEYVDRLEQLVG